MTEYNTNDIYEYIISSDDYSDKLKLENLQVSSRVTDISDKLVYFYKYNNITEYLDTDENVNILQTVSNISKSKEGNRLLDIDDIGCSIITTYSSESDNYQYDKTYFTLKVIYPTSLNIDWERYQNMIPRPNIISDGVDNIICINATEEFDQDNKNINREILIKYPDSQYINYKVENIKYNSYFHPTFLYEYNKEDWPYNYDGNNPDNGVKMFDSYTGTLTINSAYIHNGQQCTLNAYIYYEKKNKVSSFFCPGENLGNLSQPEKLEVKYRFIKYLPMKFNITEGKQIIYINELIVEKNENNKTEESEYGDGTIINVTTNDLQYNPFQIVLRVNNGSGNYIESTAPDISVQFNNKYLTPFISGSTLSFSRNQIVTTNAGRNCIIINNNQSYKIKRITDGHNIANIGSSTVKFVLSSKISNSIGGKYLTYNNIEYGQPIYQQGDSTSFVEVSGITTNKDSANYYDNYLKAGCYLGTKIYIDFDKVSNEYYTKINLKLIDNNGNAINISNVKSAVINVINVDGKYYNYDASSSGNTLVFILPYSYKSYKHQISISFNSSYSSYTSSQFSFTIDSNGAPVCSLFPSGATQSNGSINVNGNIINLYYSFTQNITIVNNTTSIKIRIYNNGINKEIGLNNVKFKLYQSNDTNYNNGTDLTNNTHITHDVSSVSDSDGFCFINNVESITKTYVIIRLIDSKYSFVANGNYTDSIAIKYSSSLKVNGVISIKANLFYNISLLTAIDNSCKVLYGNLSNYFENIRILSINANNQNDPILVNNLKLNDTSYHQLLSNVDYFSNRLTSNNILSSFGIYRIISDTSDKFTFNAGKSTNITNIEIDGNLYKIYNGDLETRISMSKYYYNGFNTDYNNYTDVSIYLNQGTNEKSGFVLIGRNKKDSAKIITAINNNDNFYCKVLLAVERSNFKVSTIKVMDSTTDSRFIAIKKELATPLGKSRQTYYGATVYQNDKPVSSVKSVIEYIEEDNTDDNITKANAIVFGASDDNESSIYENAILTEKANADERHGIYGEVQIEDMVELILPTDIALSDRNKIQYISSNPSVVDIVYFDYDPETGNEISLENMELDEENGHYLKPKLKILSVGESTITAIYENLDNNEYQGYAHSQAQYHVVVKEKKIAKISLNQDEYEITRKFAQNIDEDEFNNDPLVANQYFQSPTPNIIAEDAIPAEFGYSSSNVQIASHYQLGIILIYDVGQVKVTIYLKESKYYKSAEVSYILKIILPPPKTTTILEVPEAYYQVRFKEYTDIDTFRFYDYYENENECHIAVETNDINIRNNIIASGVTYYVLNTAKHQANPKVWEYLISSQIKYYFTLNDGITLLFDLRLNIDGNSFVDNYRDLKTYIDEFNGGVYLFDLENIEYSEDFRTAKVKLNCSIVFNANGDNKIQYFIYPKAVSNRLDVDANSFIKYVNGIYIDKHLRPINKNFNGTILEAYPVYGPNFETYGIQYFETNPSRVVSLKHARLSSVNTNEYMVSNDGTDTFYVYSKDTISDLDTLMVRHNFNDEELKYQIFKCEFTSNNTDDEVEYQFSSSIPGIAKPNTNGNVIIYKVGKVKIMINSSETKNFTAAETGYILEILAKEDPVLEINQDTFIYYMDTYTDYDGQPYTQWVIKDGNPVQEEYHGEDDPNSMINIFECPELNWKNTDPNGQLEYMIGDFGIYTENGNIINIDDIIYDTDTETETATDTPTTPEEESQYVLYISATNNINDSQLDGISISKTYFEDLKSKKSSALYSDNIAIKEETDTIKINIAEIKNVNIHIYTVDSSEPFYKYSYNSSKQVYDTSYLNPNNLNNLKYIDLIIRYLDGLDNDSNKIKNFTFHESIFRPSSNSDDLHLFNINWHSKGINYRTATGWDIVFDNGNIIFKCCLNAAVFFGDSKDNYKIGYILPISTLSGVIGEITASNTYVKDKDNNGNLIDLEINGSKVKRTTSINDSNLRNFYIDNSLTIESESYQFKDRVYRCFSNNYKNDYFENSGVINIKGSIRSALNWVNNGDNSLIFNGNIPNNEDAGSLSSNRPVMNTLLYNHFYRKSYTVEQEELGDGDIVYGEETEQEASQTVMEFHKSLNIVRDDLFFKNYKVSIDNNGDVDIANGLVNHMLLIRIKSYETDNFKAKERMYKLVILPKEKPTFGIFPPEIVIKPSSEKQFIESPKIICDNKDGNASLKFEFDYPGHWNKYEIDGKTLPVKNQAIGGVFEVDGNGNISVQPFEIINEIINTNNNYKISSPILNSPLSIPEIPTTQQNTILGLRKSDGIVFGAGTDFQINANITNNTGETIRIIGLKCITEADGTSYRYYGPKMKEEISPIDILPSGTASATFTFNASDSPCLGQKFFDPANLPIMEVSDPTKVKYEYNVYLYGAIVGHPFITDTGNSTYHVIELLVLENLSKDTYFAINQTLSLKVKKAYTPEQYNELYPSSSSSSSSSSDSGNSGSQSSSDSTTASSGDFTSDFSMDSSTKINIDVDYIEKKWNDNDLDEYYGNLVVPEINEENMLLVGKYVAPTETEGDTIGELPINVISPGTKNYAYAKKQFKLIVKKSDIKTKGNVCIKISLPKDSPILELLKTETGTQTFAGPTVMVESGDDNPKIYYESSAPHIVGVTADGTLLVYRAGIATITIKTEKTDNYNSEKATYKIHVTERIMVYSVDGEFNNNVNGNINGGNGSDPNGGGSESDSAKDVTFGWYVNNYLVDAAIDDYLVHNFNFGAQTVSSDTPNYHSGWTSENNIN